MRHLVQWSIREMIWLHGLVSLDTNRAGLSNLVLMEPIEVIVAVRGVRQCQVQPNLLQGRSLVLYVDKQRHVAI